MSVLSIVERTFVLVTVSFAVTQLVCAQEKTTSSPTQTMPAFTYPNTKGGLQQLLQDMRTAAKNGESDKLAALIKNTEIPDCVAWLHKMYDSDKADSWEGMCDGKALDANSQSSREAMMRFARLEGKFLIRKVNDDPEPGKGLEWGWLHAMKAPLDIYFASWRTLRDPQNSKGKPVGYFMFIDGGFRREGGISSFEAKSATRPHKFVPAKLIKKVDPVYPPQAISQHITGTVRVYFVIGTDGAVYNAHAISGEGLSEDPSLKKAAEEAVVQWRYQPASLDGMPIPMDAVWADVIFAPGK